MKGYQTTIVVKGVDKISGEVLLNITNDPENSVDVSKYDEVGKKNSFEYAMKEVEKRLIKEIQGSFVDKFNNGSKVFVKLKGFDFMRDVDELKECIDSLPLTKSISASPVEGKSVTYEVLYLGNPSDLQLEILKKAKDYRLRGLRATSDDGYIGFSF